MKTFAFILFLFVAGHCVAQSEASRLKSYNIKKSIAMEGFDPVSYFDGNPLEGKPDLKTVYKGVTYQFSTPANLNKFKSTPDQYEPAYGGWCAYAMGDSGEKVKIDPETYVITDGRLYLFYNFWGNNTLADWKKDEKALKARADKNWKKFVP